jgi:hypothetical protein
MLKLTSAFANNDRPVFIRPAEVVAIVPTDDCTLVYVTDSVVLEVKEDAEKIVRYLCEKTNYSGNDEYDTLDTRAIEKDEEAFDAVDCALSYASKYLEKKIEDEQSEGKYMTSYHQITLDNIKRMQRCLSGVILREVE